MRFQNRAVWRTRKSSDKLETRVACRTDRTGTRGAVAGRTVDQRIAAMSRRHRASGAGQRRVDHLAAGRFDSRRPRSGVVSARPSFEFLRALLNGADHARSPLRQTRRITRARLDRIELDREIGWLTVPESPLPTRLSVHSVTSRAPVARRRAAREATHWPGPARLQGLRPPLRDGVHPPVTCDRLVRSSQERDRFERQMGAAVGHGCLSW